MNKINDFLKKLGQFTSLPFIFSFLGALGGSKNSTKAVRRFGIPAIIFILAFIKTLSYFPHNLWTLSTLSIIGVLSIGYGTVSPWDDKPSKLGEFYYKLFPKSETIQNVLIRGTIAILFCISMLSVPMILQNWISYFLGIIIIMLSYTIISWRPLGTIKMGQYELCNADVIHYGLIGYGVYVIIFTNFKLFA